jgi:hypothetical protein
MFQEGFCLTYMWIHPHVMSGYLLFLEWSGWGGELLALCVSACIVARCIPREVFSCEFLQVSKLGTFQSEVTSLLKDGLGCPDRGEWLGV